ncbi:MAG TPA: tetratricopeptide repeat protein [Anaerolineales bacterium]|nr:tetratricopeptide repeat protein [Anaerolineales bacterium]
MKYLEISEQLVSIAPGDDEFVLNLAGSYMTNVYPAHALKTFRRFLERWPDHEQTEEVRESVTVLETMVNEMLSDVGLAGEDDAFDLALLHEEIQILQAREKYQEAIRNAHRMLQRAPRFTPAFNNLSLILMAEGDLSAAAETAQKVLEIDSGNYHALSNLTRFYCMQGDFETARLYAARLHEIQSESVDQWVKKAEAFSYLGDDQAVIDVFEGARRAGHLEPPLGDAFLYHLAAAAKMRLGDENTARSYWQKALEISPELHLAKENHLDMHKPEEERHGPWPFSFQYWVHYKAMQNLNNILSGSSRKMSQDALQKAINRFLKDFPEVLALIPVLLERGDSHAREFAYHLCLGVDRSDLQERLKQFAFSQHGPLSLRRDAAMELYKRGQLESKKVCLWTGKQWNEMFLLAFEITDEPTQTHSPQVERLLRRVIKLLHNGEAEEAENLILKALELEPDSPDLKNNLAVAYEYQKREKESFALLKEIFENYPDYLFGQINMAKIYVKEKKFDQAREILDKIMLLDTMHILEFGSMCQAQIEFHLAQKERKAAKSWLDMWENVDPEHPGIESARLRLEPPNLFHRFFSGLPS